MIKNAIIATLLVMVIFMSMILQAKTHYINIEETYYSPSDLVVSKGDVIEWVNKTSKVHYMMNDEKRTKLITIRPRKKHRFVCKKPTKLKFFNVYERKIGALTLIEVL